MNLINSIEEFKEKHDNSSIISTKFFQYNICSIEVLEYYMENYTPRGYSTISMYQPLNEYFIDKYSSKLNWLSLFSNKNVELTYEFMVKYLYRYNLYYVKMFILNSSLYSDMFADLVKKYTHKYEIDKLEYEISRQYYKRTK